MITSWLPMRLERSNYPDDETLELAAWEVFLCDFSMPPQFRDECVNIIHDPHCARPERCHTYWHAVTKGGSEKSRHSPKLDRLERMPWARPIIENEACPHSAIKVWSNSRKGSTHICIWFDRVNYIVVLKRLSYNFLLKTTYCPEPRRIPQLHREYARWKKNGARL